MIKNKFFNEVHEAEKRGANAEELTKILGRARAKKGMFEGDMDEGELEIGQISALINEIKPAAEIINDLITEFNIAQKSVAKFNLG